MIIADTIYDAWVDATRYVMKNGKELLDERGRIVREVNNLMVRILNPAKTKKSHPYWDGDKLERYIDQFGEKNPGFSYTYGDRIRYHFDVNQYESVVKRLSDEPVTRRAIMITYDPVIDSYRKEIPCLILLSFMIREDEFHRRRLHVTGVWRSHDIFGAYYPNLCGVMCVAEYIAARLGVEVGEIITHSISAHIYVDEATQEELSRLGVIG